MWLRMKNRVIRLLQQPASGQILTSKGVERTSPWSNFDI
jgi:hypothetical protein